MTSIQQKATSSLSWTALSKVSRQLFQFVFLVILARLLTPHEFGVLSMIVIFTGFADLIKSLGFGSAIIHNQDVEKSHLNTAFWSNVFIGFFCFILFILLAPYIAKLYQSTEIQQFVYGVSFVFFINSFNVVQESLLLKKLKFKKLFIIDVVSLVPAGLVAVFAGYYGLSTWSLIIQNLIYTILSVSIMWFSADWKPEFKFSRSKFVELWNYGGGLLGFQTINYFARNSDQFLVGKFLGSNSLGLYSRACHIMLLPINLLNVVVTRAMFPILVSYQNDKVRFKDIYIKSVSLIAMVLFPIAILLFIFSSHIVLIIFGEKWLEMGVLLKVFSFYTILQSINTTLAWIFNCLGKTKMLFYYGLYFALISSISVVIGLYWGLLGVSISFTISLYIFIWYPGWKYAFKLIELGFFELLKKISIFFFLSVFLGFITYITNYLINDYFAFWISFIFLSVIYILTYFFILYLMKNPEFIYLKKILTDFAANIMHRNK